MLQRKYIILTSLTMCMVAGCGTTAQNNNDTDVHIIEENEHYREIINVAITADPPTLDTVITSSNITKDIGMHVYEALFTMNEEFKPVPMLAESYEVNEDFTEFSFTLRDNVTFHNNKKMTAEDVVDSMNYWLENSERAQAILPDGKFTVTDKLTLTATFEDSALDLITLMSSRTEMPAIRPSEVYNDINDEVVEYIGTGHISYKSGIMTSTFHWRNMITISLVMKILMVILVKRLFQLLILNIILLQMKVLSWLVY